MTKFVWFFTHPSTGPKFRAKVMLDLADYPGNDPAERAAKMGGVAVRKAMDIFAIESTAGIVCVQHREATREDLEPGMSWADAPVNTETLPAFDRPGQFDE